MVFKTTRLIIGVLGILGIIILTHTAVSGAPIFIGSAQTGRVAIESSIVPSVKTGVIPSSTPIAVHETLSPSIPKATQIAEELERHFHTPRTAVPLPSPDPLIYGTVVPLGFKPAWTNDVKPLSREDTGAVPGLRYATSIWQNGAISDRSGSSWRPLILYSVVGEAQYPSIAILNPQDATDPQEPLTRRWDCPRPIGTLTITDIRGGIKGIVSFVSSSGTTGTLDMDTGQWDFK